MLDIEDDDFFGGIIHRVVDEIGIFTGYELPHARGLLKAADMGKQNQVLQALKIAARTRCEAAGLRPRM